MTKERSVDGGDMRYALRSDASVIQVSDRCAAVVTSDGTEELRGPVTAFLPELADRLGGGCTVAKLTETLCAEDEQLHVALAALRRLDVLVVVGRNDATVPSWVASDDGEPTMSPTVYRHPACGVGCDRLPAPTQPATITAALRDDSAGDDPVITLTPGSFPRFHRECLDAWESGERAWMPIRLVADEIRIGPIHDSHTTGCVGCAFDRIVQASSAPEVKRTRAHHVEENCPGYEYTAAVQRLATERASGSLRHGPHAGPSGGCVSCVSIETTAAETHDVVPLSGCPVCH
jgi:hypothetical protein